MEKKPDRRTRYTRQTIRDTMLHLMEEKPFRKITVTELCRLAEINRGTFYLHYLDAEDVLDDIIAELLGETTCAIDHIFCPQGECRTYPFCERIHGNPRYRPLFLDDSVTDKLLEKLGETSKEGYITFLMQRSRLSFQEAEALFYFQMNGCLAINRVMLRNQCPDWQRLQQTIDGFIRAGLERYLLPEEEWTGQ